MDSEEHEVRERSWVEIFSVERGMLEIYHEENLEEDKELELCSIEGLIEGDSVGIWVYLKQSDSVLKATILGLWSNFVDSSVW